MSDTTALSDDPVATTTAQERAHDIFRSLPTVTPRQCRQTWNEMSDDERDMIRPLIADAVAEFTAFLTWVRTNADELIARKEAATIWPLLHHREVRPPRAFRSGRFHVWRAAPQTRRPVVTPATKP